MARMLPSGLKATAPALVPGLIVPSKVPDDTFHRLAPSVVAAAPVSPSGLNAIAFGPAAKSEAGRPSSCGPSPGRVTGHKLIAPFPSYVASSVPWGLNASE